MRRRWTEQDDLMIRQLYPNTDTAELAAKLGRTPDAVTRRAYLLKVQKDPEFTKEVLRQISLGNPHGFKKGNTLGRRATASHFKKGHKPKSTWVPVGTERDNNGYLQRKVADTGAKSDWVEVQKLVWTEHYGPVPDGHIVAFKDGNRRNFDPTNLELITRAEIMKRNSYHNYPKEIAQLIQLRGAVQRQINKRLKP